MVKFFAKANGQLVNAPLYVCYLQNQITHFERVTFRAYFIAGTN